jgi:CheY-like chemotaxis protein
MDHMMPGMDGLEATAAIRAMPGRGELPVIALTANAVAGMREMFLQNGFSDFLSKPIDVSKLAGIMKKWIPADKRWPAPAEAVTSVGAESAFLPEIEGVDARAGLAQAGGAPSRYLNLLEMFCRDARARLPLLAKTPGKQDPKAVTTQVHALKSALASIGADDLATVAARLEEAGRVGDMSVKNLDAFHDALKALLERTETALAQTRLHDKEDSSERQPDREHELWAQLKDALAKEDLDAIDKAMEGLKALSLTPDTRDTLSGIAECVLTADFTKAADELETFLKREM